MFKIMIFEKLKKKKNTASLDFVRGIQRWPVDSPHEGLVTTGNAENASIQWRHRANSSVLLFLTMVKTLHLRYHKIYIESFQSLSYLTWHESPQISSDDTCSTYFREKWWYHVCLMLTNLKLGTNKRKLDFKLFNKNIVSTQQYPPRNRS